MHGAGSVVYSLLDSGSRWMGSFSGYGQISLQMLRAPRCSLRKKENEFVSLSVLNG